MSNQFGGIIKQVAKESEDKNKKSLLGSNKESISSPIKFDDLYEAVNQQNAFGYNYGMAEDQNRIKWINQSWGEQLGNSLGQMLLREGVGGTIHGVGSILDVPDMIVSLMGGQPADFENAITRWGSSIMDYAEEAMPIYKRDPNESFAWGDFGWWASNAVSVASTVGMLLPASGMTWGALKAAKWIKALSLGQKGATISRDAEFLTKMIMTPLGMRHAENYREALDVSKQGYELAFPKFAAMTEQERIDWINSPEGANYKEYRYGLNADQEFAPNKPSITGSPKNKEINTLNVGQITEVSADDMAKFVAGAAGWKNYKMNFPNVVFDALQMLPILNLSKVSTTRGLWDKITDPYSNKILRAMKTAPLGGEMTEAATKSLSKALKWNTAHRTGLFLAGAGSEGVEEIVNGIAQEEGLLYGKYLLGQRTKMDATTFNERLADYMEDPQIWEQAFWGTVGGGAFQGILGGYRGIQSARGKNRTENAILQEVKGRETKLNAMLLGLDKINKGSSPIWNKKYSEMGLPNEVEIEAMQQRDRESIENSMIDDMAFHSAVNGTTNSLVEDFIDHAVTKKFITDNVTKDDKKTTDMINRIKTRIKVVQDTYRRIANSYTKSNVPKELADIIASRIINNERYADRYKLEVKENEIPSKLVDIFNQPIKIEDIETSANEIMHDFARKNVLDLIVKELETLKSKEENRRSVFGGTNQGMVSYLEGEINKLKEQSATYDTKGAYQKVKETIPDGNVVEEYGIKLTRKYFYDYLSNKEKFHNAQLETLTTKTAKEVKQQIDTANEDLTNSYKESHIKAFTDSLKGITDEQDFDTEIEKITKSYSESLDTDNTIKDNAEIKKDIRAKIKDIADKKKTELTNSKAAKQKKNDESIKATKEGYIEMLEGLATAIQTETNFNKKAKSIIVSRKAARDIIADSSMADEVKAAAKELLSNIEQEGAKFAETYPDFKKGVEKAKTLDEFKEYNELEQRALELGMFRTRYILGLVAFSDEDIQAILDKEIELSDNGAASELVRLLAEWKKAVDKAENKPIESKPIESKTLDKINPKLPLLYYSIPNERGEFEVLADSKEDSYYVIDGELNLFLTDTKRTDKATANLDFYILPACEIQNIQDWKTAKGYIIIEPGKVDSSGKVIKKIKIFLKDSVGTIYDPTYGQPQSVTIANKNKLLTEVDLSKTVTASQNLFDRFLSENELKPGDTTSYKTLVIFAYNELKRVGRELTDEEWDFMDYILKAIFAQAKKKGVIGDKSKGIKSGYAKDIVNKYLDEIIKEKNELTKEQNVDDNIQNGFFSMNISKILEGDLKRNDKGEIELNEEQAKLYNALHSLKAGSMLTIKPAKPTLNGIDGNTEIGIYLDNQFLGYVPHLSTVTEQIAFVNTLLKPENLKSLSLMYPALYELKTTNSKKAEAFNGKTAISRYLLDLFQMPNEPLKSAEFEEQFNKKLDQLLRITVKQDRTYVTYKETTVSELENSYNEWKTKLVNDQRQSFFIRAALRNESSLSYEVQTINTGDIQFLHDNNAKKYQPLTALESDIKKIELLGIEESSNGFRLNSKVAGVKSIQPHQKAEGYTSGGTYTTVEGFGFKGTIKTRIPVPLHRSSFFESYSDAQTAFNEKAPDALYEMIMNYVKLSATDRDAAHREIANIMVIYEKKDSITFKYGNDNLMIISKNPKFGGITVNAYDKDGKAITFTDDKGEPIILVNAKGEPIKYLISTNPNFKSVITNAIKQSRRNVKYSIDQDNKFTFAGVPYNSYKHFLIETGAIVTDVTNVVDSNGKKLGNVGTKAKHKGGFIGRSLKIMVAPLSMKNAKDLTELYSKLFAENKEIAKWEDVFTLANQVGVTLNWNRISESGQMIDGLHPMQVHNNQIIFYKEFLALKTKDINNALLIVHELLHPIVNESINRLSLTQRDEFRKKLVAYNTDLLEAVKDYKFDDKFSKSEQRQIKMILGILQDAINQSKNTTNGYHILHDEVINYALTDKAFSKFLATVKSTDETKTEGFWDRLVQLLVDVVNAVFPNKLTELKNILNTYIQPINFNFNEGSLDGTEEYKDDPLNKQTYTEEAESFLDSSDFDKPNQYVTIQNPAYTQYLTLLKKWEALKQDTREFRYDTKEKADFAYSEGVRIFGEFAIRKPFEYESGKYRVTILKPRFNGNKEIETEHKITYEQWFNGLSDEEQLLERLRLENDERDYNIQIAGNYDRLLRKKYFDKSSKTTSLEILKKIANSTHPLNKLANHLIKYAKVNNAEIELVEAQNYAGAYDKKQNKIFINDGIFNKGYSEPTILHEILHSLTVHELENNTDVAKTFKDFYEYAKSQLSNQLWNEEKGTGLYGLKDEKEFIVSLFTNSELIYILNNIPAKDNKKYKNFFEEIFNYLLSLLGIDKNHNLYSQAYAVATQVLENYYLNQQSLINNLERSNNEQSKEETKERVLRQPQSVTITRESFTPAHQISPIEGLSSAEFHHAVNVLTGIIFNDESLKAQFKGKEFNETGAIKNAVGKILIDKMKEIHGNGINPDTLRWGKKVKEDLLKNNSIIWLRTKSQLANLGIFITDAIEDTDQSSKFWNEDHFSESQVKTISTQVKIDILRTPKVDPTKVTEIDGRYELDKDYKHQLKYATISGLPTYLGVVEINDLIEKLRGSFNLAHMMDKLKLAAYRTDPSYMIIYNSIAGDEKRKAQWFSFFSKQKPDQLATKILNVSNFAIQNYISNKSTNGEYLIADQWYNDLVLNLNQQLANGNDKVFIDEMRALVGIAKKQDKGKRGTVVPGSINDLISKGKIKEGIAKLITAYSNLSILIEPEFINKEIEDTQLINKVGKKYQNATQLDIQKDILYDNFIVPLERFLDWSETYLGNNNTEFEQFGEILALAKRYYPYSKSIELTSGAVDGTTRYSISNHNFLSKFFEFIKTDSEEGKKEVFEYLSRLATAPGYQHDNFLWNDSTNTDYPTGLLDYTTEKGIKVPTKLSEKYIERMRYFVYDGAISNINSQIQKYKDLNDDDFALIAMSWFLQLDQNDNRSVVKTKNFPNDAIFTISIPSDKTTFYPISGVKTGIDGIDIENNKFDWGKPIMRKLFNVFLQQYERMIFAADTIFNQVDGVYTNVKDGAETNNLFNGDFKFQFVEYKHFDKIEDDKFVFLRKGTKPTTKFAEGELTGKVFNVSEFNYEDSNGKYIKFPITGKQLITGGWVQYESQIKEHIENFIKANHQKGLKMFANSSDKLQYDNYSNQVLEFMLNDFIQRVSQHNLFFGNTFEYKDNIQIVKRAFQIISPVRYGSTLESQTNVFYASTVNDIELASELIKELGRTLIEGYKETYKDKAAIPDLSILEEAVKTKNRELVKDNHLLDYAYSVLKNYSNITTTDGQSYITLDEFENRTIRYGIHQNYQEAISKAKAGEKLNIEEAKLLLQPQKEFYYNRTLKRVGDNQWDLYSEQVKNSTYILNPNILREGSKLKKLHDAMVSKGIAQVNFKSTVKVGAGYVLDLTNKGTTDLVADYELVLDQTKTELNYDHLGIQQELPSDVVDHRNKQGKQISKVIHNNLRLNEQIYKFPGEEKLLTGSEVLQRYVDSLSANIKGGAYEVLRKLGVDVNATSFFENIQCAFDKNSDFNPSYKDIVNILISYASIKGMTHHDLAGLEILKDQNHPMLPLFYTSVGYKWQEVLTNLFTNSVINLRLPGPHAIQASQSLIEINDFNILTSKQWDSEKKEVIKNRNNKLHGHYWEKDGTFHPDEILLPKWTKHLFAKKLNVDIDTLDISQLNIMVGYRIPTEDKHSIGLMKVVGFLPDEQGSTVIVPDEFIARTGSDFDIDTIYFMSYATEIKNGKLSKIQYLDDSNSTVEERFNVKYRPIYLKYNHTLQAKEEDLLEQIDIIQKDEFFNESTKATLIKALRDSKLGSYVDRIAKEIKDEEDKLDVTLDKFKTFTISEQNSHLANGNRILDTFYAILSNKAHAVEHFVPNYSDDIQDAKKKVNTALGINEEDRNPLTFDSVIANHARTMAAVTLKGMAVNITNFVSFAQVIDMKLDEQFHISFSLTDIDSSKPKENQIKNIDDLKDSTITLSQFGKWPNEFNSNNNYLRYPITVYGSQGVANILDAVKDSLPPNIDEHTLTLWSIIPSMGGTWQFSTYLMNTDLFREYRKSRSTGLTDELPMSDNGAFDKAKSTAGENYLLLKQQWMSKFVTNEAKDTKERIKLEQDFEAELDAIGNDILPSENDMLWFLNPTVNNKEDAFKYQAIYNYVNKTGTTMLQLADFINAGIFAFSVDRSSIGPNLFNIQKVDNNINKLNNYIVNKDKKRPLAYVEIDGIKTNLVEALFEKNIYSPISYFYHYGFKLAERVLEDLFINKLPGYSLYHDYLNNYSIDESVHRRFDTFVIKTMLSESEFFKGLENTNIGIATQRRIMGISDEKTQLPFYRELDIENTDNLDTFKSLSLANKIDLIKHNTGVYKEWRDSLDEYDIFDYLETHTTPRDLITYQHQAVRFRPVALDMLQDSFMEGFYSNNPFIRDIFYDLVKYSYITNGMGYGRNINRLITPEILFNKYGTDSDINKGIDVANKLYELFNADYTITGEMLNQFLLAEPQLLGKVNLDTDSYRIPGSNIYILNDETFIKKANRSIKVAGESGIFANPVQKTLTVKLSLKEEDTKAFDEGKKKMFLVKSKDIASLKRVSVKLKDNEYIIGKVLTIKYSFMPNEFTAFIEHKVYDSVNKEVLTVDEYNTKYNPVAQTRLENEGKIINYSKGYEAHKGNFDYRVDDRSANNKVNLFARIWGKVIPSVVVNGKIIEAEKRINSEYAGWLSDLSVNNENKALWKNEMTLAEIVKASDKPKIFPIAPTFNNDYTIYQYRKLPFNYGGQHIEKYIAFPVNKKLRYEIGNTSVVPEYNVYPDQSKIIEAMLTPKMNQWMIENYGDKPSSTPQSVTIRREQLVDNYITDEDKVLNDIEILNEAQVKIKKAAAYLKTAEKPDAALTKIFEDSTKEYTLINFKQGFAQMINYYQSELLITQNILKKYNKERIKEILETGEGNQEMFDDLLYVNNFINSVSYLGNIYIAPSETLGKYSQLEKDINALTTELTDIKRKTDSMLAQTESYRKYALEIVAKDITTNPLIINGLSSIFDSISDETLYQRWLDPLADTHDPMVASIINKYFINMNKARFEVIERRRKFNEVLEKHGITSSEQFKKYLISDNEGADRIIQEYNQEYKDIIYDYRLRLSAIEKRTGNRYNTEYLEVQDELSDFLTDNMQSPYSDEYVKAAHEVELILRKNKLARELVTKHNLLKREILETVGFDKANLTMYDMDRLNDLNEERIELTRAGYYDDQGRYIPKTGAALEAVNVMKEYFQAKGKLYEKFFGSDLETDASGKTLYEREKAKIEASKNSELITQWHNKHTVTVYTKSFWDKFKEATSLLKRKDNTGHITDLRKQHKDSKGVIDGTRVRNIEDIREVLNDILAGKEDKTFIPKAFNKPTGKIYTDKYYEIKKKGEEGKVHSVVAKIRDEATREIYNILQNNLGGGVVINFRKLTVEEMTRLNEAVRKFDLATNLYNELSEYRGSEFYQNEIKKKGYSYGEWFRDNHDFVVDREAFEQAEAAMLESIKDPIAQALWYETFTYTKIDPDLLNEFFTRLKDIASSDKDTTTPSNLVKISHLLKSVTNSTNEVESDKLTTELKSQIDELIGDKVLSKVIAEIVTNNNGKPNDLASQLSSIASESRASFEQLSNDRGTGNPFEHMEYAPSLAYIQDLRKFIKLKPETETILSVKSSNYQELYDHLLANYSDNKWFMDNHYISATGIAPMPYYTKLEPKDKNKIDRRSPKELFFADITPKEDKGWIDEAKTEAAEWLHNEVDFVTTSYYQQAMLEAGANQGYKVFDENGNVQYWNFNQWYFNNHYYDPYSGTMKPIGLWTRITPHRNEKGEYINKDYVQKDIPAAHWYKTTITEKNENYKPDSYGNPLPRDKGLLTGKDTGFRNPKYDLVKDDLVYKELVNTIAEIAGYYGKRSILDAGYLPSMEINTDNNILKKVRTGMGWYKQSSKFSVEGDDQTVRFLDFPFIKLISGKDIIKYGKRKEGEDDAQYEARIVKELREAGVVNKDNKDIISLKELEEENKHRYEFNKIHHKEHSSTDVKTIMNAFIEAGIRYKYKKMMESELLLTLEEVKHRNFKKNSSSLKAQVDYISKKVTGKSFAEEQKVNSNLAAHMADWLKMIFYDDFEIDEGTWTKIARVLQNYTSAKGMWFNVTGALNNVAFGKTQMLMERMAGVYWDRPDGAKAEKEYWKNMFQFIANSEDGKYLNKLPAVVKYLDVLTLTDEQDYKLSEEGKNELFRQIMNTNNLFLLHHLGEHYMQNKALIAMLYSHRIINGKIMSFDDYYGHLSYLYTKEFLSEPSINMGSEFEQFVARMKKKYEGFDKYTIDDYTTWFLQLKGKSLLPRYREFVKGRKESMRAEFESNPNVLDTGFTFDNGFANVNTEKISKEEIARFRNKVVGVNHKIHGIYNKESANSIQQWALGRLAIQFRKHVRPGINKRFGTRYGKPSWNEARSEWNRGAYIDAWRFITRPVTLTNLERQEDAEGLAAEKYVKTLTKNIGLYISNVHLYYSALSEAEKSSIKRVAGEWIVVSTLITVIPLLLSLIKGDDDDEDKGFLGAFTTNAGFVKWMEYQQDRMISEMLTYYPYGIINESRKLFRTPVASMSSLEQAGSILNNVLLYPFRSPDERLYKGGIYNGEDRAWVAIQKSIPFYNQLDFKFDHIGKYYKLYGWDIGETIRKSIEGQ